MKIPLDLFCFVLTNYLYFVFVMYIPFCLCVCLFLPSFFLSYFSFLSFIIPLFIPSVLKERGKITCIGK